MADSRRRKSLLMKKYLILFLLICMMCCACASAEEADAGAVVRNPYLDIAFSCLEEGNPILTKYNALTGANIEPMLKTGMPYYFGGQDFSRLLTVGSVWETTRYGIKGQKYVYGFDCVGFIRYIQTQMGDELIPSLSNMINTRYSTYKDYCLVDLMEMTVPFAISWNGETIKIRAGKEIKKPRKYPGLEMEHETFVEVAHRLEPGDLFVANHGGRHVMMFIGTLRQYGYTVEDAGELGEYLDYPLFINCVWNPDYVARMEAYIAENDLKALPNKGGVCITIVGPRTETAPHMIEDTEREKRPKNFYYFNLGDYHLSLMDLSTATSFVWWRTPADKRGNAS